MTLRTADGGLRTLLPVVLVLVLGCESGAREPGIRLISRSFSFHISSDPMPPHAREPIVYKVIVRDRKTAEPIENGEGRIFATSRDAVNVWDSFVLGPELGTYYARLRYITAGDWAVAVEFRRDSTYRLERVDWMQDVRAERAGAP